MCSDSFDSRRRCTVELGEFVKVTEVQVVDYLETVGQLFSKLVSTAPSLESSPSPLMKSVCCFFVLK